MGSSFFHRSATMLGLSLAAITFVSGQDPVDIGLFQEGNALEVRIRPTRDFDGILSAIVFTVKWDKGSGASLGELVQEGPESTYLPIAPSGAKHEDGSVNYQVYAGFGFDALSTMNMTLEAGKEYTVARIPFTGTSEFELADDTWTGRAENNADYYLSLNGRDMTGVIYKGLVNASGEGPVSIQPNPNQGQFTLVVPLDGMRHCCRPSLP